MGKEITERPLNRVEIDAYNDLTACTSQLIWGSEPLEKRLKENTKTGWRDLRLAISRLSAVIQMIGDTIPMEKRRQLRRTAEHCRVKLIYGPEAAKDPEMHLIRTEDFGVIMYAALEQCQICMGSGDQCRTCQLGKALDRTSWVSRGSKAWWQVFAEADRPAEKEGA